MFRFVCPVALWGQGRGGGALQTNVTGLCGEHSQFSGHTMFAPARGGCVCFLRLLFSGSRLLSRERALHCMHFPGLCRSDSGFGVFHKSTDSVGPAFCVFPGRNSSGSQELDEHTLPSCRAPSPLRGPSLSFHACRSGAPCVSSGELDSRCDPPSGCQPSRISGSLWLETGSLFALWKEMLSLGPSLPPPPASGGGWTGPPLASFLWYLLSPSFWELVGSD